MKILVTGSKGQLGSEIKFLASSLKEDFLIFVDVEEMDLTSEESIITFWKGKHFDIIINCAAYTAVDQAEQNAELAHKINSTAVKVLVDRCKENQSRLIHISTDYVFDGYGNTPLSETSPTNPLSVYGESKLQGEKYALSINDSYVLRTAGVYSTFGKNFVKTISILAKERASLSVVYDQIGSPTYARDLASVILKIIQNIKTGENDIPGLYHYSNEGAISWFDLANFIVDYHKYPSRVLPIRSEEYKTLATRPKFSVLDKSKIKNVLKIEIPHWYSSLKNCLCQLKQL